MDRKGKMMIWISLGIIVVAVAGLAAYFAIMQRANPPLKKNEVRINNAAFEVEIASTTVQLMRGLSYRASLGADQGMLFIFSTPAIQNFWMKDMNFPLDMIWIGGDKVLGFVQNAEPVPGASLLGLPVYSSPDGTDKVLEVNAGTVAKDGIKTGDTVEIGV